MKAWEPSHFRLALPDPLPRKNRLAALFGHLPGWTGDRHPSTSGYNVIADETAKWLAPVIRAKLPQP